MRRHHGRAAIFIITAADRERQPIAGRHHDAGWPQFDVELDRFARRQRLNFVMRVEGAVRKAARIVELAVRGTQPALRNRRVRILRTLERHFAPSGANTRSTTKRSASTVDEEM